MKFSTKLTLALIFAATVPVALVGYGISLLNEQTLRQNAQEYYLLAAERTQEQVSTHIQEKARVLENVTNVLSTNSVEERAVMPVVKQLLADAPNLDALGVYDIRGAMADAIVKERGTLIPARLQLTEVGISTSASFTLLDPIFPETAKMPSIPLVKPLVSNGRRIGYCVVFIKTEDLCGIVENISRRLFSSSPSKIRIVTDSLRLIAAYSRNAVQVAQNRGFASPLLNNSRFSFVGVLQDYSYSEGAEMLGAALSLPLLRSIVLVEEPRAVAFAAVRQIRWNTLWWVILCGVCGGLLGVLLSKQISKPLQELSEATSKLALRDFSATLLRERTDEFGGLFAKHNALAGELAKYEALNVSRIIAERNKLETVVRQAKDGILLLDEAKKIQMINAAWSEWFGIDSAKEGLPLEEVLSPEHDFSVIVTDMLETQELVRSVEFRVHKAGEVRALVLRGTVVKIQHEGRLLALMALVRDVTGEVETDRMKTELVAVVAHELRSPLNSINGLAELIGEGVLPKEEAEEYGRTIAGQSKKLAGIISKFLDLNRMESGKAELRRIPVRVDEIVRSVIAINSAIAQRKHITIETKFPATTPPVMGDPDLLGHAVLNLLTNAVKYSEQHTTIYVEIRSKADEIVVVVKDQGYGISESSQAKLFTKFFRATDDERVRKDAGTGLGLAFVKEIAMQHGGNVGVESRLNQGSTFWFSLPL